MALDFDLAVNTDMFLGTTISAWSHSVWKTHVLQGLVGTMLSCQGVLKRLIGTYLISNVEIRYNLFPFAEWSMND